MAGNKRTWMYLQRPSCEKPSAYRLARLRRVDMHERVLHYLIIQQVQNKRVLLSNFLQPREATRTTTVTGFHVGGKN